MNTLSAAALPRDVLLPRPSGGMGRALVLAVVAHLLLVAALSFSVSWHTNVPDAAEAELWAAVPQAAAPRAQDPPPTPALASTPPPPTSLRITPAPPAERPVAKELPDAQIAMERDRARRDKQLAEQQEAARQQAARQRAEKDQAEKEQAERQRAAKRAADQARADEQADAAALKARQAKAAADAKRQIEAQAQRLQAQREANLKRIIGQAGGSGEPTSVGSAAQSAGPSADYIGRIKGRIRPNVSFPNTLPGNPAVEIEVRVAPDGRILSGRVVKPSGAAEWDDAVLRAIEKTQMLPRDENGRVPSVFTLVYRPRD